MKNFLMFLLWLVATYGLAVLARHLGIVDPEGPNYLWWTLCIPLASFALICLVSFVGGFVLGFLDGLK